MLELYLEKPYVMKLRNISPPQTPKAGEAKLKTVYGGICGSDLRVYQGVLAHAAYPVRPGHELLGVIVETGCGAPFLKGQKMVVFPNTFCEECEFCLKGATNICKLKTPMGIAANGVFAEQFIIENKYLIPVPENLPDERAILIEPLAVVIHALKKVKIDKTTTIAIIGCGAEGLLAATLTAYWGADVTAIDINDAKLNIAQKIGGIKTAAPKKAADKTFDIVIEAAGAKASIEQAIEIVKPGGDLIIIGITEESVEFPAIKIVRSEITIHGTIIYTKEDFLTSGQYLLHKKLNTNPIISKIFPLIDFEQAFETALSGDFAKVVLDFQG
jgi:L-iditol 2-dehydrogenase